MLKDIIKKNIEKHSLIDPGDLVILGLSGGPDSMCLMDVLYNWKFIALKWINRYDLV